MFEGSLFKFTNSVLSRFLIVFLLLLPNAAFAFQHSEEAILDYSLEVSFGIEASRVTGIARIPVKRGQEVTVHKGRLNLVDVTLDKEKIDLSAHHEMATILPGKYSAVSFDHGINVSEETDQSTRGITEELLKEAVAVDISNLKTLPYVVERVAGKKIIYVGETHDQFSHHVMQLEIIKDLHRRRRTIAIGMEMFQRPFQKALDEYIEGRTDEREFLKTTEYFKRWGFDYNLYRPILQFARLEKIPVVALNIRQEIVDKVFQGGLDSLSGEEKEWAPSLMDFSDDAYKERLKNIFQEHEDFKTKNFDFFYQAQILWDETMSESIDRFLRIHPDYQMIVLAGSGHLAYGSGIPKRTARRNGYSYAIILNDADLEKDVADYVLFPGPIPELRSPKLMVLLTEDKGKVEIAGFPPASKSEKAGMKVGDLILSIDHTLMHSIDDVKIELLFRKKGDKVKVRILRKTFLGSPKEVDFEVSLQ